MTAFYRQPIPSEPLRQGDIFRLLPKVEVGLEAVSVSRETEVHESRWIDLDTTKSHTLLVAATPVWAIVVSQDCDVGRGDVSLCEIDMLERVSGFGPGKGDVRKWIIKMATTVAREQAKWFYLPKDTSIGFRVPMAVSFSSVLRFPAIELDAAKKDIRIGRIRGPALKHFQRKLAEYFTRYAYNEWYPLSADEFESYREIRAARGEEEPRPRHSWQEPSP